MVDCVFCLIAQKNIKADIVYENSDYIAFKDISPKAPVHVLIIPKEHIEKDESMGEKAVVWSGLMKAGKEVIEKFGLNKTGYRIAINGAGFNHVDHEHIHILGGKNWKPKDGL